FDALTMLTPSQAAELTLSSGALYNTDQIDAVFDRLETEEPFQNIDEYLTQLSKHPELPEISPAVKDIMMNRTFHIIDEHFPQFESQDWTAWFHVKLIPILASFQAEMLAVATSEANCTNYQIIVGGVSKVSGQMTQSRKQEIAQVLLDNLKESVLRFSEPACREDIKNDADFLQVNLGSFSKDAPYSELKALNITGLEVLDALSPTQKVDLLLDPSLDALENETTVRIVFSSIVESPEEEELDEFFEAFVEATAQENRTIIENPDVRDTMLNLTLKALAPRFPTFEASDFALWFQVYLVVLLPSFHPESLLLIPMDISCDSYHAILKGLDQSLASLPFELQQGIKSSKDILTQKVPKQISPAVKDIMMNRTFHIIDEHFPQFESQDWTAWFHVKLIPILASFQAEMLAVATSEANCTNYQIIVGGVSKVSGQMTQSRKQEIAQVLLDNLKESVLRFSEPACREDIKNDADFLQVNLGSFSKDAPYSELKALNITGLEVLDALSPTQKVDLLLDPSLDALENETTVRIVFSSIVESPEEEELDEFFEAFVEATAQENRTIIENPDVRDTMLNLTLKALAPRFPTFEASDFALWFQVYLVVLLPSFHPESLLLIPMDISCDSYHAILKGLDQSLASLPFELQQGIKSSKDILTQKVPKRCTVRPVVGECEETPVDEMDLCAGVNSHPLELNLTSEEFSGILCAFSLESYACSSTQLTAENLATLLKCKLSTNLPYSTALWKLFFMKMSDVLAEALFEYAGMTSNINGPLVPEVLDAIGEIQINKFSEEELKNVSFIKKWFEMKLRPFFPSVSNEFLSCLSTKDFSCETYQAVVRALSEQISSLDKMRQRTVYSHFIYLFLSRNDTSDTGCLSNTDGSTDWLETNFGNFSVFAPLDDLLTLNENFSSFDALTLLTPSQAAELTLSSGALYNTDQIDAVFDRLETEEPFQNIDEYLTQLSKHPELPEISPAVKDIMMNRTFHIIDEHFPQFESQDWKAWFHVKLIPILASVQAEMLAVATSEANCTNYQIM
ncbi:hypothetical protein JZ751_010103, partial [Albula glossodonta]